MTETSQLRLDVWLWRARFFRTRGLCADHIRTKGVHLSGRGMSRRTNRPGTALTVGDVVTFSRAEHIYTVEVMDLGSRRGPPAEASLLYRHLEDE